MRDSLRFPPVPRTIVVTGTSTEIGKTFVTARLIEGLRTAGVEVHARKPAQSFEEGAGPTDAEILALSSGEPIEEVCPPHRWYPVPMAPPMAVDVLSESPFTIADLVTEISLPDGGITFVEGAGGPRSPLASDGDTVTLAEELDADLVLLVADAGLGTINAVRLSAAAFGKRPLVVFLNRYDVALDLHVRNRRWLEEEAGLDVVVEPAELVERLSNGG